MSSNRERRHCSRGLTLIEVLVVIILVAVLIGLLLPAKTSGGPSHRARCVSHLKQVGLGFLLWAEDRGGQWPMQVSTNQGGSLEYVQSQAIYRHFLVISNELGHPKVLVCPSDADRRPADGFEKLTNTNITYFLVLNPTLRMPGSVLAGDRNVAAKGQRFKNGFHAISTNQSVQWDAGYGHGGCGNLVFADGHVEQCNATNLPIRLSNTGQPTNWLAFP